MAAGSFQIYSRKNEVYVSFRELEKAYDRENREGLWQVPRLCDVGGKLLNGIKSIYVSILACVRIKGGEGECFKIDSGEISCIMFLWLFNVNMDAVMKEVKWGWVGEREWRLTGLLNEDGLVLCGELEEDLRVMVRHFVEVFRRGLKVNEDKSKFMVSGEKEGLECEVCQDGIGLEHVSEFKYLGCFG